MAFLKKFDIKQICVVNHQDINILSNFGLRKTKNREMIGSSVKDFGSFYQKTLEPIFSKDRKKTALLSGCHCSMCSLFLCNFLSLHDDIVFWKSYKVDTLQSRI